MEYYINIDNEKRGPYTLKELAERGIEATTLILALDTDKWVPAWQIEELRNILMVSSNENIEDSVNKTDKDIKSTVLIGEKIDEIPYVEAKVLSDENCYQNTQKESTKMKGCLIGAVLLIILFIGIMIFTCPNADQHKEALSDVVTQTITESAQDAVKSEDNDFMEKAFQNIADVFARKIVDMAVDNLIHVDNYIICSVGRVHYGNSDKIVSFGLLNHVFTVDKEQLKQAAEKYYKTADLNIEQELEEKLQKNLKEKVLNPTADLVKTNVDDALNDIADALETSFGEEDNFDEDTI